MIGSEPLISAKSNLWVTPIYSTMVTQMLLMQHITFNCQVCHVTSCKFSPWANKLVWFVIFYVIVVASAVAANPQVNLVHCINALLAIVFLCNMHFICHIVNEITTELGIRVFVVKPKLLLEEKNIELM